MSAALAYKKILDALAITTAVAGELSDEFELEGVDHIALHSNFDYGSSGTTVKIWLQTTLDDGETWIDIINHAFTTSDAKKISSVSRSAVNNITPGDAALADNTSQTGILGRKFRLKRTTTGTYAGATTLTVTVIASFRH